MKISAIIPAVNEEGGLLPTLRALSPGCHEILLADGQSSDNTRKVARETGCRVVESPPGRGRQMARAAGEATGDVLLFCHADTLVPRGFDSMIRQTLARPGVTHGAFLLGITPPTRTLNLIAWGANLRTRLFNLPYGDQALFVRTRAYRQSGGFSDIALMEDVKLVRQLNRAGKFGLVQSRVFTSARRWEKEGPLRATLRNYRLILSYTCLNADPARLQKRYRDVR